MMNTWKVRKGNKNDISLQTFVKTHSLSLS